MVDEFWTIPRNFYIINIMSSMEKEIRKTEFLPHEVEQLNPLWLRWKPLYSNAIINWLKVFYKFSTMKTEGVLIP